MQLDLTEGVVRTEPKVEMLGGARALRVDQVMGLIQEGSLSPQQVFYSLYIILNVPEEVVEEFDCSKLGLKSILQTLILEESLLKEVWRSIGLYIGMQAVYDISAKVSCPIYFEKDIYPLLEGDILTGRYAFSDSNDCMEFFKGWGYEEISEEIAHEVFRLSFGWELHDPSNIHAYRYFRIYKIGELRHSFHKYLDSIEFEEGGMFYGVNTFAEDCGGILKEIYDLNRILGIDDSAGDLLKRELEMRYENLIKLHDDAIVADGDLSGILEKALREECR